MSGGEVHRLAPFAHVADVARSIEFYTLLGFKPAFVAKGGDGKPYWAHMKSGTGSLLLGLADAPISRTEQGIMLYMYCEDVAGLRQRLLNAHTNVSEIRRPPYMQEGEIRVEDPDGYTILIGQAE
jgi:catechol 2,3-dioxygenase-like lactoylglutathione lyase family enzyme